MSIAKDMQGRRIGMLTVGARVPGRGPHAYWTCVCDCGASIEVASNNLRKRKPVYSCGCVSLGKRIHGMTETATYRVWVHMRKRCRNPKDHGYANYGGRGIKVCERWDTSFENFLNDMGKVPAGHSIERRDNAKGYSPDNCCWLPTNEQSLNRRGNIYVEVNGETVTAMEAARRFDAKYTTVLYRLRKGQTIMEAVR